MSNSNHITTKWLGKMAFESNNPSGHTFVMDAGPDVGGEGKGMRPKALMLSSLAGCSGLDVAMLIGKMKLAVRDFVIDIRANLSEEHPKYYYEVFLTYHFYGDQLDEKKLRRAVDLSVEKYCGVMEMFRRFAEVNIALAFHHE